nr:hypothetical protein [Streptomyces sp. TSRI0281]
MRVRTSGGSVTAGADGTLTVTGADSAWFVLAAGTDYTDRYPAYRGEDPHRAVTQAVDAAAGTSYEKLREDHVRDHRTLFVRSGGDPARAARRLAGRFGPGPAGARRRHR